LTLRVDFGGMTALMARTSRLLMKLSASYTVADGKVSAVGADVSGSIGRESIVRVSIGGAYANGHLSGNAGSGKWNGASAGIPCSGHWEASRR
jgi:hypothetical protein